MTKETTIERFRKASDLPYSEDQRIKRVEKYTNNYGEWVVTLNLGWTVCMEIANSHGLHAYNVEVADSPYLRAKDLVEGSYPEWIQDYFTSGQAVKYGHNETMEAGPKGCRYERAKITGNFSQIKAILNNAVIRDPNHGITETKPVEVLFGMDSKEYWKQPEGMRLVKKYCGSVLCTKS